MANELPTAFGGLRQGLGTGLAIGQALQQRELLRQQQAAEQARVEQEQSMAEFDQGMKIFKAAKEAGLSNRILGNIWNSRIMPQLEGRGANLDFEGRGSEISKIVTKMYDNLKGGKIDLDTMDTLFGNLDEEYRGISAPTPEQPAVLGAFVPPATDVSPQPTPSPFAFEPAPAPRMEAFAKLDPAEYTSESLKLFEQSGSYADLVPTEGKLNKIAGIGDIATREMNLRKEFSGASKAFIDISESFARIQASAEDPSAAGDLALIFNYMKMLDPASVVRESEFRTAEQARAWLSKSEKTGITIPGFIARTIQKMRTGEKLLPEQRGDFVNRAAMLFDRQFKQHRERVNQYTDIAKRNKLNPDNVIIDIGDPEARAWARLRELELKEAQ